MSFTQRRQGFRKLSASHIVGLRKYAWTCRGCGLMHETKPVQCKACGRLDFVKWDSKAELRRFGELNLLRLAGKISRLETQVRFPLLAFNDGKPVKVGEYVADFVYQRDGARVIEDAKGDAITDLASWKVRHMAAQGTPVNLVKVSG